MIQSALLYLAVTAYGALFVCFSTAVLWAVGGRTKAAQLGLGPKLRFRVRGIDIALAPIPGSAWIEMAGRGPIALMTVLARGSGFWLLGDSPRFLDRGFFSAWSQYYA